MRANTTYYKKVRDAVAFKIWKTQEKRIGEPPPGQHSILEIAVDETEFDVSLDAQQSVA